MKKIRFNVNFYGTDSAGNSRAVFEAGKDYPADDAEARRCIARGISTEVEVPDEPAPDIPEAASVADEPTDQIVLEPDPTPEPTPAPTAASKKK